MAIQQRRTSKTRKRLRRTHFKLHVTGLVTCPNCGALIKSHHVCPKCHFYGGKLAIADEQEAVEPKKTVKAKAKKAKKVEKVEKVEEKAEEKKVVKKTVKKTVKKDDEKTEAKKTTKKTTTKKAPSKTAKAKVEDTKVE